MSGVRSIAALGILVMAVAVGWGITSGGLVDDFSTVWAIPWGRVGLIDLFVGLGVVGAVIVWRERDPRRWLPWLVALVVLGNLTTAAYVLWALRHPSADATP